MLFRVEAWMIAIATGLGTFGLATFAAQDEIDRRASLGVGGDMPHLEAIDLGTQPSGDAVDALTVADRLLQEAWESGSDVVVARPWRLAVDGDEHVDELFGVAVAGQVDWGAVLINGAAPGPGEVVISARVAEQLDVGVADVLAVADGPTGCAVDSAESKGRRTVVVSGLAHGDVHSLGFESRAAEFYVAWSDARAKRCPVDFSALRWTVGGERLESLPVSPAIGRSEYPVELPSHEFPDIGLGAGLVGAAIAVAATLLALAQSAATYRALDRWRATAANDSASAARPVAALSFTAITTAVPIALGFAAGYVVGLAHLLRLHITVPNAAAPILPVLPGYAVVVIVIVAGAIAMANLVAPILWVVRTRRT